MIIAIILSFSSLCSMGNGNTVQAHSGRTDSRGGHRDNKNKSGLGSYHYHCGGYSPHLHKNGVCPYKSGSSSTSSTGTKSTSKKSTKSSVSKETVKAVQSALNDLGYDCGEVDGIVGNKTKVALKKYQADKGLIVDGIIGKQVKESLKIK